MVHLLSAIGALLIAGNAVVHGFGISTGILRKTFRTTSAFVSGSSVKAINDKNNDAQSKNIDDIMQELLDAARRFGPVGTRNTIEDQEKIQRIVTHLKQQMNETKSSVISKNYTDVPLLGVHDLIYSAAPGGSSGKIGPFIGRVTQTFVNETTFINAVNFGPLDIALTATRRIKDESTFIVKFEYTTISLFGIPIIEKSVRGQGGVWNVIYTGIFHDKNAVSSERNQKRLLRIMETPSLFVIEQVVS